MNKTITIDVFDPASVDKSVREILQYNRLIVSKCEALRRRVALLIATTAREIFSFAVADDLISEGAVIGGVDVTVEHEGDNVTVIIANGEDAVFMEFGAGVYHNGAVGNSPNPWGSGLGYTIGSYGKGNGKKNVWGFRGADGQLHLTHGVPASMPMYRATMAVADNIVQIAREVFST